MKRTVFWKRKFERGLNEKKVGEVKRGKKCLGSFFFRFTQRKIGKFYIKEKDLKEGKFKLKIRFPVEKLRKWEWKWKVWKIKKNWKRIEREKRSEREKSIWDIEREKSDGEKKSLSIFA